MVRHPSSDRLTAIGMAVSVHVAIGCALLLAAKTGGTVLRVTDADAGSMIAVQLLPLAPSEHRGADVDVTLTPAPAVRMPDTRVAEHAGDKAAQAVASRTASIEPHQPMAARPEATVVTGSRATPDVASADVMAYRARLQAHLARYRLYPAEAKDAGRQGVVLLHFTMDRAGGVTEAWVETSSGLGDIDREAVDAVRRAVPLPPPPAGFPDAVHIRLPVSFKLS